MAKRIWNDQQLGRVLRHDPLDSAEKITGKSIHNDQYTAFLGLGLNLRANDAKREMLEDAGDSHWGTTLDQYHQIIERLGFERLATVPFCGRECEEFFEMWWEPKRGIFLKFDTYGGNKVNSGKFYYNWRHPEDLDWTTRCHCTSSGHYTKCGVWIGDHDCREAIAFHIRLMEQHGEFVVPWVESQQLGLYHYGETSPPKDSLQERFAVMDKASAERMLLIPERVRTAIVPLTTPSG